MEKIVAVKSGAAGTFALHTLQWRIVPVPKGATDFLQPPPPSASAGLQLLDMPECILQHISTSMPAKHWAIGPALTCRTLNELHLPVVKVRSLTLQEVRVQSVAGHCSVGVCEYPGHAAYGHRKRSCFAILLAYASKGTRLEGFHWRLLELCSHIRLLWRYIEGYGVRQVKHYAKVHHGSRVPELFTWMGKRINATRHLAIHINYNGGWGLSGPEALLNDLLSSGHGWMAKMETLDLSIDGPARLYSKASLECLLQHRLMSSCCRLDTMNLSIDRDPSWLLSCRSMRHICLHLSPPPTGQKPFHSLSGMQSMYLPHLETLYLQGYESLELRCIDFRDSGRLEVVSVLDCWIDDFALPPSCKVCVSAQSCSFILHMDETRQHPLVSSASHVCLPTDLQERVSADGDHLDSDCYTDTGEYSSDEDWSDASGADGRNFTGRLFRKEWMRQEDLRKSAMGIPDMFPAMRSLRLTWPDKGLCLYYHYRDYKRCYIPSSELAEEQGSCGMSLFYMRCLSDQWQHPNLHYRGRQPGGHHPSAAKFGDAASLLQ